MSATEARIRRALLVAWAREVRAKTQGQGKTRAPLWFYIQRLRAQLMGGARGAD